MKRILFVMFVAVSFLLAGCGDDSKSSSDAKSDSLVATATAPAAPAAPAPRGLETLSETPPDSDATVRKEITTGSVYITAKDPIDSAHKTISKVEALQGRIDDRTEQPGTDNTTPSATLTVRVPSDKTDQLIEELQQLGRVTNITISKNDVTMQVEDLDARIRALQTSVDRLRALIAGAANTADLLQAENALSSRQADLDSLSAQKRRLDDQIDLSTLTIQFTTEDVTPPNPDPGPSNFWDGIASGWNSLVDALADAVVFVGKAIPWLAFFGAIGGVAWFGWRVVRRRGAANQATQANQEIQTPS
jgi:TolA-binding protein